MKFYLFIISLFISWLNLTAVEFPAKRENPWQDDYSEIASIKNFKEWGTYNVHDPAVMKVGDTYYMYSTDAIYRNRRRDEDDKKIKEGNIQVRSSKDLVHWEFEGWAFDSIPSQARKWVLDHADGKGATNIWAPFPVFLQSSDTFRLYYCVSAFGLQTSYIGLAESNNPLGPWTDKGCVVKTQKGDKMNAIDPSVITDKNGRMWMHYGSYFGGLYVVELDATTGFTKVKDDQGHLVARRENYRRDNLEAPEIMYNPLTKYYYLFVSYEPLMTTYNIRVGRSKKADGPFYDFFGKELKDTTNNYPLLTYPYKFENHPGWAGTGHCGVINDGNGKYFLAHQARLSPEHHLMDLHVREIFWTSDAWPVISPQRYAGDRVSKITKDQLLGEWELIYLTEGPIERGLEYGQILWGENKLLKHEFNPSLRIQLTKDGLFSKEEAWNGTWKYTSNHLVTNRIDFNLSNNKFENLIVFVGQDWENQQQTLLITGLDKNGRTVWGKKVK